MPLLSNGVWHVHTVTVAARPPHPCNVHAINAAAANAVRFIHRLHGEQMAPPFEM